MELIYVGPGMGAGVIAATLGILLSLIISLFAILWYPFKKLIQFIKSKIN
jgi:hypothetical protein